MRVIDNSIKVIALFALLCSVTTLSGQDVTVSHRATWNDPDLSDSSRIDAFRQLIWKEYLFVRPDSAFILGEQLLAFSDKANSMEGRAMAYNILGISKDILGDPDAAIEYQLQYLAINEALNDTIGMGYAFNNLGVVYQKKADYDKALIYLHRALEIDKAQKDSSGMTGAYSNIGNIYFQQGQFPKALDVFERGLAIGKNIPNKARYGTLYQGIGLVYSTQKDFGKALEYYKRALAVYNETNDLRGKAPLLNSMGTTYDQQEKPDSALLMYQEAAEIAEQVRDVRTRAQIELNMGTLYMGLEEYDEAMETLQSSLETNYRIGATKLVATAIGQIGIALGKQGEHAASVDSCTKSLEIAETFNMLQTQESSCSCLYVAYRAMKDNTNALKFFEKLGRIQDSLHTRELISQLEQVEFKEQVAKDSIKRVEELYGIQADVERKKAARDIAIGGGIGLLLITVILVLRNRSIKRSKIVVEQEKKRTDSLVLNMFPADVAEELLRTGKAEPREYGNVTVLFTDFVRFTEMAAELDPKELVSEIDQCFAAFDAICQRHGVEKIKTVGDAYMAATGLPTPSDQSTEKAVHAALEMLEWLEARRKTAAGPTFEMRVGIHTGSVVAGIVGTSKFQYDIWGDTVNIASRMESHGTPGRVNISSSTYSLIQNAPNLKFEVRQISNVKGLGEYQMVFVDNVS